MKPEQIGSRLKIWRKHLGFTQSKFADVSGVHIGVLKKYERGVNVPGGEALGAFSSTGVNINWLLTGEGDMIATTQQNESDIPHDLQEFENNFDELFETLLTLDEPRRKQAINEMVIRVKEAARMNEMERKLIELEKEK